MIRILNIESSTDICSVSISINGEPSFFVESKEVKAHTRLITLLIQELMAKASLEFEELDAVAVCAGPGSYTSLRIGATTAKAIAYAHNIPLVSVCTLKSLANSVKLEADEAVIAMIDARRDEVYAGVYKEDLVELMAPVPHILENSSFSDLTQLYKKIYLVGNGAEKSTKWLCNGLFVPMYENLCSAINMASLSYSAYVKKDFVDITYFTPNYIKGANITKSKKPAF